MKKRGCGFRQQGGLYAESSVDVDGKPPEWFLYDPPFAYRTGSKVGVEAVTVDDDVHVIDYVGKKFYPMPVDFIEEARVMGISRRLPKTFKFELLSLKSHLILVHELGLVHMPGLPKGFVAEGLFAMKESRKRHCRLVVTRGGIDHLHHLNSSCSGDHWIAPAGESPARQFNDAAFQMWPLPARSKLSYEQAAFMSVPITRIVGIKSDHKAHDKTFEMVRSSLREIPFEVVPE